MGGRKMRIFNILGTLLAMALASPALATNPRVGDLSPNFSMTLIDGSKVTLADLRGQVVVINFWATWCAPCRTELPTLDAFYTARKRAGLRVFAVATEDSLPFNQLKKLFAVMHMSPVKRISGPYRELGALPTNYVIDRAGRVRYAKVGALELADLKAIVVPLLRESVPVPAS